MKTISLTVCALGLALSISKVAAQTYTYTVESSKTTITGFAIGTEPTGAIVVPATLGGSPVTEIGRAAFKDRAGITSISFGSGASVTKVGASAFQGCTGLQSIALPSGITGIPAGLLQGCTSLNSVTVPTAVTTVGDAAFAECKALPSVILPTGLASIGESAFLNCASLTSVTVPAGVTALSGQVFSGCKSLANVSLPAGVTSVGYSAFRNCPALTSFALPDAVVTLGNDAFHGCAGLTVFSVGTGLASIGERVLLGCGALGAINVPGGNAGYSSAGGVLFNKSGSTLLLCPEGKTGIYQVPAAVGTISPGAFAHCDGLSEVGLPAGLAAIAADAFYYAGGLVSFTIPESVGSVGAWAVAGCAGLEGVKIPAGVTSIADDAFHSNGDLTWALFNGDAPASMGARIFDGAAAGFTIYHYAGETGFTVPTWLGYASAELGTAPGLVAWLLENGFSPGTSLLADGNHDGVSLLMAYALGLDPAGNLAGSLPTPVLDGGALSLSFLGNKALVTYGVETSADLVTWTTDGVTLSEPDGSGLRTATVAAGDGARFLRLAVTP